MPSRENQIREQTRIIADLHSELGRHRLSKAPRDSKWKKKERDLAEKLAHAYGLLARLKDLSLVMLSFRGVFEAAIASAG